MKLKLAILLFLPLLLLLPACDLEKDIEVNLPNYDPQLVVECYLEPGLPYRMTVLESSSYFDTPQPPLVPDAKVVIMHNGRKIPLYYKPIFVSKQNRIYTHSSPQIVRGKPGDIYTIEVTDSIGRKVTGITTLLPKVPIDTIEWKFNDKGKAYLLTSFNDDPNTTDFYRYIVNEDSLQTSAKRDIILKDDLTNGKRISIGSAYNYERGDTLIISLYHIEKQYYDFLNTTSDARDANGNPFAQPSQIKSSVQDGLGIFTTLSYDRKQVVIQ